MKAQPENNCDRIREGDELATDLGGRWPITKNEIHAAKYGTIGVFVGAWAHVAFEPAITLSITLFLIAYGLRKLSEKKCERSIALLTIRHEPHWFTALYLISYVAGYSGVLIT